MEDFITARRAAGKADATINRETELLRQAFRLALEDGVIPAMPKIPRLPEHNVREGFFTRAEFEALVVRSSFPTIARLSVKPRRARSSIALASV